MQTEKQFKITTRLERVLVIVGAFLSIVVSIYFWIVLNPQQTIWPFPVIYFIEMVMLSIIGAVVIIRGITREKYLVWVALGALLGFSILGLFSVGLFYLSVALVFADVAVTSDIRNKQNILAHLGIMIAAAIIQGAIMLAIVRLLIQA